MPMTKKGSGGGSGATAFQGALADTAVQPGTMPSLTGVRLTEDASNGTSRATLRAPTSLAADVEVTVPDKSGTLATTGDLFPRNFGYRPGAILPNLLLAPLTTQGDPNADQIFYLPLLVGAPVVTQSIGVVVTAAGGSGIRLGVNAADLSSGAPRPGALIADAGLVDTSSAGTKEAPLALALSPGLHFLAFASSGASFTRIGSINQVWGGYLLGAMVNPDNVGTVIFYMSNTVLGTSANGLPAAPPPLLDRFASNSPPYVFMRAAA